MDFSINIFLHLSEASCENQHQIFNFQNFKFHQNHTEQQTFVHSSNNELFTSKVEFHYFIIQKRRQKKNLKQTWQKLFIILEEAKLETFPIPIHMLQV